MNERKLAVFFCSSYAGIDPKYNLLAHDVVEAACKKGYGIVSGGSFKGTMNVICQTAHECGVTNKGVMPTFMRGLESDLVTELVWESTMSARKEEMRKGTSLAVALPGGLGTLDELAETMTLIKVGQYEGKMVVMNYEGFYEPLKSLLNHYVRMGMLGEEIFEKVFFPTTVEEFKSLI